LLCGLMLAVPLCCTSCVDGLDISDACCIHSNRCSKKVLSCALGWCGFRSICVCVCGSWSSCVLSCSVLLLFLLLRHAGCCSASASGSAAASVLASAHASTAMLFGLYGPQEVCVLQPRDSCCDFSGSQ
jgi:hypothetical protein